jgi:prefoldin subunit 4
MSSSATTTRKQQSGGGDSDVHISHENQKKINRFAIMNGWIEEIQEGLAAKKSLLTHLEDAENDLENSEVLLLDPDFAIPMLVGESFVHFSMDEMKDNLKNLKQKTNSEISSLDSRIGEIKSEMDELKKALYEQFGNNINLENNSGGGGDNNNVLSGGVFGN